MQMLAKSVQCRQRRVSTEKYRQKGNLVSFCKPPCCHLGGWMVGWVVGWARSLCLVLCVQDRGANFHPSVHPSNHPLFHMCLHFNQVHKFLCLIFGDI